MGYIFSVNISPSGQICALEELSTMAVEPSESNPTCSEYSTLEDSMWHILSFEIVQKTKALFLVWTLGGLYLAFQLILLEFGLSLLVVCLCLTESVVGTLSHFSLNLSSL